MSFPSRRVVPGASEAPAPSCCPLCGAAWATPSGLKIIQGKLWFRAQNAQPIHGGVGINLLTFLLQHPGQELSLNRIYNHLYAKARDGGPSLGAFKTHLSRLRRALREYGIPIRIDRRQAEYGDAMSGSLMLVHLDRK
jgi:hypothetical protein